MRIVVDVDGVLADFTGALCDWLNKKGHAIKRGHHYGVDEFRDYRLTATIPEKVLKDAANDPNFVFNVPRFEGAQQFLKDLLAQGHQIDIVTAPWDVGPYHRQAREDFMDAMLWKMRNQGLPVTFDWATAEERVMMPGDLLIDDKFETALAWAKTGRPCILFDQPWNRDYEPVPHVQRFKSYSDILLATRSWGK